MPIRFGTDGWRGIIADDFTFANVQLCAQGVCSLLKTRGQDAAGVVIGYDTRFGSAAFADAVAEVTAANGIKTFLADRPAPTPVMSYNVISKEAGGGVIITASHNSQQWNGFKFKPAYGGSATQDIIDVLERHIEDAEASKGPRRIPVYQAEREGLVERFNPTLPYLRHIRKLVDMDSIQQAGLKVSVDSMHGAGAGYLTTLLSGDATTVTEIRGEPNPAFPGMSQPEPLPHNLANLIPSIPETSADVGLATDGDADRIGVVDEQGRFLTTLQSFAILCLHQLEVLGKRGPLVRSITMTSMVDKLGQIYSVPVFETPVGFKNLGPVMMREDALAAGEESGGYAFQGHIPERDGIFSGLMFLEMMVKTGKKMSELIELLTSIVGPHHYDRWDLMFNETEREHVVRRMKAAEPTSLAGRTVEKIDTRDGYRFVLESGYWALVRFSGTEPLLRVYAEGESQEEVERLLVESRVLTGI